MLIQKIINVRHHKLFELSMIFIILFSALTVGARTYKQLEPYQDFLSYLDIFITVIFLIEIVIRYIAEGDFKRFVRDPWNLFDTIIVVGSLIPLESSNLVFVGRLLRIFRVLRLISFIPELRLLLNALFKSLPRLGYLVLLMFIFFYIYGAIGSTLFGSINPFLWGDISRSMLTLFRVMTFEDWTDVMYETMAVYKMSWAFYVSFIFFTAFAFLNMIIGIVVNVIEEEHQREVENDPNQVSLSDLKVEIESLKRLIEEQHK